MLLIFLLANSSLNSDIRFVSISYALERFDKDSCYAQERAHPLQIISLNYWKWNGSPVLFIQSHCQVILSLPFCVHFTIYFPLHWKIACIWSNTFIDSIKIKSKRYLHYVHFGSNLEWCCHVLKLKILISNSSCGLFIDTNIKMGNILGW